MEVEQSVLSDVDLFREFWAQAVAHQKTQDSGKAWREFPQALIESEIAWGNHYTVTRDGEIVGYFSLAWSDAAIWTTRECGDAIYLHRMCVNPNQKGARLAEFALNWATDFARRHNRRFVRIDTWRESEKLIAYYQKVGFKFVGEKQIGDEPTLQPHYRNISLALFENEV